MRWLLIAAITIFPSTSFAAVIINEVAWMGDSDSANHEWIELHNNSSTAVDVTGWELSDGMKLSIVLSGSIGAGDYAVLERTSEESAAGTAFFIYTGALVNTGATLTLKRADGSLEDQVGGGENWENIGGDNITKETAQYTTSGWITAAATPAKVNATSGSNNEQNSTTTNGSSNQSNGVKPTRVSSHDTSEPVRLILPDVTLKLKVDAQSVGYVNQEIDFSVKPSGIGDSLMDSLVYVWNFGDGNIGGGKKSSHVFAYPGTYVVTVYGSYKRQEQVARHEITILPVTVSLTRNAKGDVQINNDSPYEIDISGYTLVAASKFTFPSRSILLPNQTVTISKSKLGSGSVSLLDASDALVVGEYNKSALTSSVQSVAGSVAAVSSPVYFSSALPKSSFTFAASTTKTAATTTKEASSTITNEAAVSAANPSIPANSLPYLGLIGIIAVGTIGVLVKPNRNEIG